MMNNNTMLKTMNNHSFVDIKKHMVDDKSIYDMAEVFKALNDPTRLKIINILIVSELCVNDIANLLEISQPAISHHLKELRQLKLIKYHKKGRSVFYSLDDEHIHPLFQQCLEHVNENTKSYC
ncbi:ArsR/SmtB family transcription factor [Clostridium kluyveri]|uniref:Predicted transcriptional regulator n=2 Tax=Clostridium kluyveri TaxID=1534 RepID=A5N3M1_CLOK5|nr:metalloregulator ArsR/SmtB family transcription factor [Clostridium kluyveri]EDK35717.1 Predicted transcriptional regulator [Clostridium kluyveri DSM 555]